MTSFTFPIKLSFSDESSRAETSGAYFQRLSILVQTQSHGYSKYEKFNNILILKNESTIEKEIVWQITCHVLHLMGFKVIVIILNDLFISLTRPTKNQCRYYSLWIV